MGIRYILQQIYLMYILQNLTLIYFYVTSMEISVTRGPPRNKKPVSERRRNVVIHMRTALTPKFLLNTKYNINMSYIHAYFPTLYTLVVEYKHGPNTPLSLQIQQSSPCHAGTHYLPCLWPPRACRRPLYPRTI